MSEELSKMQCPSCGKLIPKRELFIDTALYLGINILTGFIPFTIGLFMGKALGKATCSRCYKGRRKDG